jgi:hypothetical protein
MSIDDSRGVGLVLFEFKVIPIYNLKIIYESFTCDHCLRIFLIQANIKK